MAQSSASTSVKAPNVCPICHQEPLKAVDGPRETGAARLKMHMGTHRPVALCTQCEDKQKAWILDWDLVLYPREGSPLFYCHGCGRYAA
jgi:hypothetical protein